MLRYLIAIFSTLFTLSLSQNNYKVTSPHSDSDKVSLTVDFSGDFKLTDYIQNNLNPDGVCDPIKHLQADFTLENRDVIHLRITDRDNERWEAKDYIVDPEYEKKRNILSTYSTLKEAGLVIYDDPFSFEIVNPVTKTNLYSWKASNKFLYSDNLIVYSSDIASKVGVYGLGERVHELKLQKGIFTISPNDTSGTPLDDNNGGKGTYSSAPFYFYEVNKVEFFGVLLINTNVQDYVIRNDYGPFNVETRLLGGVIDLYFIRGFTVKELIQKQQDIIGRPALPPYWALGWHQCKYGYETSEEVAEIVNQYNLRKLPLDTMWTDIDYMEKFHNFTIDKEKFKTLPQLVKDLHAQGKHYIPIIDLGIPVDESDTAYSEGKKLDLFIKSNYTDSYLINDVWPGHCVFVDWFNPSSESYWVNQFKRFNKILEFDGVWLDMNEPATLNNDIGAGEICNDRPIEKNMYHSIPYLPGNGHIEINTKNISSNSKNHNQNTKSYMTSYNTRPLNAFFENLATHKFLIDRRPNERSFILTRSANIGLGRHSAHWLGDNFSSWESMRYSVPSIMTYGFFGYSMIGVDVCGFINDSVDTLCARWHMIGAFYPFSRNHNAIDLRPQEPWAFGDNSLTLKAFRKAITVRYSLLRYYYSELYKVHTEGGIFYRPLFYDYQSYDDSYFFENDVIMLGDSFLQSPNFTESPYEYASFFPKGSWVHFPSGKPIENYPLKEQRETGALWMLPGSFDEVNVFLKEGQAVPCQLYLDVSTIEDLKKNEMEVFANIKQGVAKGEIIYPKDSFITDYERDANIFHITITKDLILINRRNTGFDYSNNDRKVRRIYLANSGIIRYCSVLSGGALCYVRQRDDLFIIELESAYDISRSDMLIRISSSIIE